MMASRLIVSLVALMAALGAAPVWAASVEVTVRDSDGGALDNRHLRLSRVAVAGETEFSHRRRQPLNTGQTDAAGKFRFDGLEPGTYAIDVGIGRGEDFVQPADNPFAPPSRVTLFDESDHLPLEIVLWRGVRVMATLDLPGDGHGFRVVFHHPGSGLTRSIGFQRGRTSIERLLPPGVWDVSVEPRPGYLLVDFERDRVSLPGHQTRLDLVNEPSTTFLTWTYVTPAEIEGYVSDESGRPLSYQIVATLVEPGPWHSAVVERGGSIFERLTTMSGGINGFYSMVVPDGRWRVEPVGEHLLSSEPEFEELTLSPGETGRADFVLELGKRKGRSIFMAHVVNERRSGVRDAAVEVFHADDLSEPLRVGTTGRYGDAELNKLGAGSYLVVAGHPDYLEGRIKLADYDPDNLEKRRIPPVVLPDGAEIRLRTRDPLDEPLAGVVLTVERLGDAPEMTLQNEKVIESKLSRSAVSDQSGRATLLGFYPGSYRLRAKLGGERGTRGLVELGLEADDLKRELEVDITGKEKLEVYGRLLPAASLSASLVCSDDWDIPDTVSVRVLNAFGQEPSEFEPDEAVETDAGVAFSKDAVFLGGRLRDRLTVGPFERGIYYLALRPRDFDRWTWVFESYDPAEAAKLQVEVAAGDVAQPTGPDGVLGGPALADVDLGQLRVECAPAIDLLPVVAGGVDDESEGGAIAFPDVREVKVEVHVFDRAAEKDIRHRISITQRDGRIELRNCPGGWLRLDVTLTHPHFLPEPSLTWQLEMELERGAFHQIVPEIESLGGSIVISGPGASASLFGAEGVERQVSFNEGEAEIPSLVPGRYRLEVLSGSEGADPIRVWPEVEVRVGETLTFDVERR